MDGQNTNQNVLNLANSHLVENGHKNLNEIGSCSLHIVQTGAIKTGWELTKSLKQCTTSLMNCLLNVTFI